MEKEWVLITGASRGIGSDLARKFAARGSRLVLVARDNEQLSTLARELSGRHATEMKILVKDLSCATAAAEIFSELERESIPISILVNNAGFGSAGYFAKGLLPTYSEMLQVNVGSLVQLTHLFVQPMLARREGRILNVASTAAFEPGPLMAVYYASKAFVFSFSYALADELAGSGVSVTALCPGPTRTDFQARAGMNHSGRLLGRWMMPSSTVAEAGVKALMAGKRVVIPGLINKLGFILAKVSPISIASRFARKIVEP